MQSINSVERLSIMNITENQAYLNWRFRSSDRAHNYASMADGYCMAAQRLAASLLNDNIGHDADVVIFPILFSAQQSLELYLKAIQIRIAEANSENPWVCEVEKSHDLVKLLNSLNKVLPQGETVDQNEHTQSFFELLDLFKALAPDSSGSYFSDFARYAESLGSKKRPRVSYAYVDDDKFVLNIQQIGSLINEACDLLAGIYALWEARAGDVRNKG